ncbi:helix-turn-helix domain-containing protein [Alkalicoccobacillus porphyridii]|uniref:Helix-turn-helix transcriptional regulator n=1 Tax=Alkalicoccobacillus porphyridii TaxID=2597270 RepID=A0A553ZVT1_9BACI|nr:helix-turn-helix transcriptional regulator [Alkalicoccobacillus porphyridii]TSB45445.1 helix-turn-helix transcriptional regulator [Alkalicoccobacillus porphyridii]
MEFGPIIKYYRLKSGITQAELADGICSIPHLSKIENNAYSVNKETAALLMERLGLDMNEEVERYGILQERLEEFTDAIFYYELDKAKEIKDQLELDEEYYSKTNLVQLYHIYMARFFTTQYDFNSVESHLSIVEKNRANLSPVEELLYRHVYGSVLFAKGKHRESLDYLLGIRNSTASINSYISMKELSYQIALCYSVLGQRDNSIPYAHEALQFYIEKNNFIRTLHSQILLAINYESMNLFEEAKKLYISILRNTKLLNLENLYYHNLYNYSLLLISTKEFKKAIINIEKCISYFEEDSEDHILAIIELVKIFIEVDNKNPEIDSYLKKLNTFKNTKDVPKKMKLLIKEVELNLAGDQDKQINFLEKEVMPFLEKNNDELFLRHYSLILAKMYDSKGSLSKALSYYRKYNIN